MPSARAPPVIDFSYFLSGNEELAEIREACMARGFFQIINHTIPLQLQHQMLELSKQLFDLPLEEKMALDNSQNEYNRGHQRMASQMIEAGTAPDFKEGFYLGRDLPSIHPQVQAGKFAHSPNLWPERLGESFHSTSMLYLDYVMRLGEHIMQAHRNVAWPVDTAGLQKSLGAHRDFGALTLLLQDDVPSLEVWDGEVKEWAPVPLVEDAYVINWGNMFQQWTNDQYAPLRTVICSAEKRLTTTFAGYRSVIHRVVNYPGVERYSIPANFNGNPDFIIKCIENCRGEGKRYAPVTVEDYIRPQYADAYSRAGVYNSQSNIAA